MSVVKIYTDGACLGNPGDGGWGYIIIKDDTITENYGGEGNTTNNRMEMTAVIQGLFNCNNNDKIIIFTDSKYVINGVTTWINNWKDNDWKTSNKKEVKNKDLWILIDTLLQRKNVSFKYVKAHSGDYYNERADALAKQGANF